MDAAGEIQKLENEKALIQSYLDNPFTRKILSDNEEQQQTLISLILNEKVMDIETFFAREQALGHLRGLRRGKSILDSNLEEIEDKLKELRKP